MIEFPKHVYLAGDPLSDDSFIVKSRDEEASARARGYVPAPHVDPVPASLAPGTFLEYPKVLYGGEETRIVKDADQEAAARAEGYLGAGEASTSDESADATSTPVNADTPAEPKSNRRKK